MSRGRVTIYMRLRRMAHRAGWPRHRSEGVKEYRMHPRLLTTPFITLHTFGVLLALAYLATMWWVVRCGLRDGMA